MKVHIGVEKDTGVIHSLETTFANVSDISQPADLLHGDVEVVFAGAGYQGIQTRKEIANRTIEFRVVMMPGKCRAPSDTGYGSIWWKQ